MCGVVRAGWALTDGFPGSYTVVSAREVSKSVLSAPLNQLLAIKDMDAILSKGAGKILMGKPDMYYKCLLALPSLTDFHEQPNFPALKNVHFAALAIGAHCPPLDAAAALPALEDEERPLPIDDGAVGEADEEGEAKPYLALPVGLAASSGLPEHAPVASFAIAPMDLPNGCRVHFDNFSSRSLSRRAIVTCRHPDHGRCVKETYFHRHDNDAHKAAAWLGAWEDLKSRNDYHIEHLADYPDAASVATMLARMTS